MLQDEGVYYSTDVSLSGAVPQPPERRQALRHLTILRVGKLISGESQELCLVRNISSGGIMAHVYSRHHPEEEVAIELQDGMPLRGHVQWVEGGNIGIRFIERINVGEVLSGKPLAEQGYRLRAPRVEQSCRAQLRIGNARAEATLMDVSQGGAKLETDLICEDADKVVLLVPQLRPIDAIVRWARDGRVGLEFVRPLAYAELTAWLSQNCG